MINELITRSLNAIASDYDEGVVILKHYLVPEMWEMCLEDRYVALNVLDDISAYLRDIIDNELEQSIEIRFVCKKTKTFIYISCPE